MGLESVTNINDLVATNPVATDAVSAGDDHIRALKLALKTDFPNFTTVTTGMTATQAELSILAGVTAGTVTASKGVVVGSTSKVDVWNVDNVTINGNDISTTNTNGDLVVSPNGTGDVDFNACSIMIDTTESIKDAGGDEYIQFIESTTPVNHLGVESADTTENIKLSALGEADSGIQFENDQSEPLLVMECVASSVNWLQTKNAATGANAEISAQGEADSGILFNNDQSEQLFIMECVASAVNEITSSNSATGNGVSLSATGGDTNVNINLVPKGSGKVDVQGGFMTSETASLSGAGAIPITGSIAEWTTTAADAGTLADGVEGQHLFIILIVDGGNGVLTPANPGGYSTITFADAGDSVHVLFTNGKWYIVGQGGLGTGPLSA